MLHFEKVAHAVETLGDRCMAQRLRAYNALRGGCGRDAPSNLVRVGNALGAIQFQPPLL
jgi:hypothetical protein